MVGRGLDHPAPQSRQVGTAHWAKRALAARQRLSRYDTSQPLNPLLD